MSLIEALLLLLLVASAVAGSVFLGSGFGVVGYVLGPLAGASGAYIALRILWLVEQLLWIGLPHLPRCSNPHCSTKSQVAREHGYLVDRCECGRCFARTRRNAFSPTELFEVLPNGDVVPYMRWQPMRGWTTRGPFRERPRRLSDRPDAA
jgi:hypothetical protein